MTRPFGRSEQQANKIARALAANKTVCIMCATEAKAATYLDRVTRALSGDTTPLQNLTIIVSSLATKPLEGGNPKMWIDDLDFPTSTPKQRTWEEAVNNWSRGFGSDWNYTSQEPTP